MPTSRSEYMREYRKRVRDAEMAAEAKIVAEDTPEEGDRIRDLEEENSKLRAENAQLLEKLAAMRLTKIPERATSDNVILGHQFGKSYPAPKKR